MKSLTELWRVLANELARRCHTSATRDFKTVSSRVEREGESFLTITLPAFGKDFERGLDQGKISDDLFSGFARTGGLPRFLGGFLRNVFDEHGAVLVTDDLMVDSIFAVRQLCAVFGKIERECTDARNARAIRGFVTADQETGDWDDAHVGSPILQDYSRISSLLYADVLSSLQQCIADGDIRPKHGPGKVADRLSGNAKYDLAIWPARLDAVFPFGEYGVPGLRYHYLGDPCAYPPSDGHSGQPISEEPEGFIPRRDIQFPQLEDETPSRVMLVPKTMKTPRVIAAELTSMQFMQQGLMQRLVELLESKDSLVHGMVGFTSQTENQELARKGSHDGSLATLDMSEASDRVSLSQVTHHLTSHPWVKDAFLATRSSWAALPNGEKIFLRKFASMGSALCFPAEAMSFLTACFMGIEQMLLDRGSRRLLTKSDITSFRGSVRVYGDDIIVPADSVDYVLDVFARLGWKTNVDKSFWTGKFRESCGGDYYDGVDVTPIRFRQDIPASRKDAHSVASLVAFRNQLYMAGLWETTRFLDQTVVRALPHFPIVEPTSALLGRQSVAFPFLGERTHPDYQSPLVRGYKLVPRIPKSKASELGALLKCLLSSHEDSDHLERSGRPSVVDIKLTWSSPF